MFSELLIIPNGNTANVLKRKKSHSTFCLLIAVTPTLPSPFSAREIDPAVSAREALGCEGDAVARGIIIPLP